MDTSCFLLFLHTMLFQFSFPLLKYTVSLPYYIFVSSIPVVFQHLAIKTDHQDDMTRRSTAPPPMETSLMLQLSWKKRHLFLKKKIHFKIAHPRLDVSESGR